MSTNKYIDRIGIAIMIVALLIGVIFMNGERIGIQKVIDTDTDLNENNQQFTANDLNGEWDTGSATMITLSDTDTTKSFKGGYMLNGDLIITEAGRYVLSGKLSDGSVVIDASKKSKIWIQLDNLTLNKNDNAAFRVEQADKVFLTLKKGTSNVITSGTTFCEDAITQKIDGVIFARDDLTVNGDGSLKVTGGYKYGIAANDDLIFTGGNIQIEAAEDAIHVNDQLKFTNAHFQIKAGDDAIHSDTEIYICDGAISIEECYEGLEAPTILMDDGEVTIYCRDDGINANGGANSFGQGGFQPGGGNPFSNVNAATTSETTEDSVNENKSGEALNSDSNMGKQSGNDNMPDSSNQNGSMPQPPGDGDMPDSSNEDGSMPQPPGDGNMPDFSNQNGSMPQPPGDGNMPDSSNEDGSMPQPPGDGNMPDSSNEDGSMPQAPGYSNIPEFSNENQGEDSGSKKEASGTTEDSTEEITPSVTINGGTIRIINTTGMDADGIDSNGNIIINGGDIYVSLPGTGVNCALDYGSENGGSCQINGGTVVAAGGAGMIEEISGESKQVNLMYIPDTTVSTNNNVILKSQDGKELINCKIENTFQSIVLSCPQMKVGETYLLTIGNKEEEIEITKQATMIGTASGFGSFGGGVPGDFGGASGSK